MHGSDADPSARWIEHLRSLALRVSRLRAIYGTAITAELALRQQGAELDPEVADCLRVGVCDPIADQVRELEALIERFRRATTGGKQ